MKKQILQVSVVQSARVMAGMYFIITMPIAAMIALFAVVNGQGVVGLMMAIMISIAYALGGFMVSLLGAWIYNLVAARLGGFEFVTAEVGSATQQ